MAFLCPRQARLKNRLAARGMRGKALRLLEDYLHERHIQDPSRKPKRCTILNVFRDSAAGALPAIWAKLPQTLVLREEDKGWRKIAKQCKNFLIGRKPKIDKNTQGKKQKMIVIEQLAVSNSTVLNQELN